MDDNDVAIAASSSSSLSRRGREREARGCRTRVRRGAHEGFATTTATMMQQSHYRDRRIVVVVITVARGCVGKAGDGMGWRRRHEGDNDASIVLLRSSCRCRCCRRHVVDDLAVRGRQGEDSGDSRVKQGGRERGREQSKYTPQVCILALKLEQPATSQAIVHLGHRRL